jgi:hypothetical protein
MIPWLFSLSVDIRSWVFPVNIYTWIKSLFTSSSSVNPRSTDENQGEASRESHGLAHPSGAVQVTFYLPPHVATTFPGKSRAFVAHRKRVCCCPGHVYLHSHFQVSIVIEFRFLLEVRGFFCCRSNLVLLLRAHLYIYQSTLVLL